IGDRVADHNELIQQLPEGQRVMAYGPRFVGFWFMEASNRFLEVVPVNKAHGIEWPALGILPDGMNRHNARMLQPAGDFGSAEKAATALRVAGVRRLQAPQCHIAA